MSSSSSSEMFCRHPDCYDSFCSHFDSWDLIGITTLYTDNGKLYVSFSSNGDTQSIEIYDDSSYYSLVAFGSGSARTITITEQNGSGINGTVFWDGVPVGFLIPENSILYCAAQSTSSSSSSSSSSTGSSSSILSTSSSSSSSILSTSSSTYSSSSSSSESSVSFSSESVGNTSSSSSSSSSSFVDFNQLKPLYLASVAIPGTETDIRLAQTISLTNTSYSIGNVYCYLYSSDQVHNYNIYLSIYDCNSDGTPLYQLYSSSISGLDVVDNGWYTFEFNLELTTPANGMISFVMYQDGGDEDNYVMWGYSASEENLAWTSKDGINWINQPLTLRSLKMSNYFDLFDLVNHEIVTPPAEENTLLPALNTNTATYTDTIYLDDPARVEIKYPDLLMSFVMDSSGSMGWNDRFNNRCNFASNLISRFIDYYPANVAFDIIKFGSWVASSENIATPVGQTMPINLDLNNPTRRAYIFEALSTISHAEEGSVYTNQNAIFKVRKTTDGTIYLECMGESDPLSSGTLVRVSGFGDDEIVYSSYTKTSFDSKVIGYGFKNLENAHTYNLSMVAIDNVIVNSISLVNYQLLANTGETPSVSVGINGPTDAPTSLDFSATTSLNLRRPLGNIQYNTTLLTSSVDEGDITCDVSNSYSFSIGSNIDLVSNKFVSIFHNITNVNSNILTFEPASKNHISTFGDGLVQFTSLFKGLIVTGTTLQLFLKDSLVTRNITFYLQDENGYEMEWDFKAHDKWYTYNLYWLGDTAKINISLFDKSGIPYPDGTKVILEVDNTDKLKSITNVKYQNLIRISYAGDTRIYLESTDGFIRDNQASIIDNSKNQQIITISEIGTDSYGSYIDSYEALLFTFNPNNGAMAIPINEKETGGINSSPVSFNASFVDVTPICAKKSLNPALLQPYDITPVDPSTTYDSLNNAVAYIRLGTVNMPTIDGYAVARVLPITEDVLETLDMKATKTELLLTQDLPVLTGQQQQNSGDLEAAANISSNAITTTATTEVTKDYTILSPVYLRNGHATSTMKSYANVLKMGYKLFPGVIVPGVIAIDTDAANSASEHGTSLLVRSYRVYPSIEILSKTNVVLARQYFDSFIVDFTPRYQITSLPEHKYVKVYIPKLPSGTGSGEGPVEPTIGDVEGYRAAYIPGVYAGSGETYTINYIVTDKLVLLKSGTLSINVYSNKTQATEDVEDLTTIGFLESENSVNNKNDPIITTPVGIPTTSTEDNEVGEETVYTDPYDQVGTTKTITVPAAKAQRSINTWRSLVAKNPTDYTYSPRTDLRQPAFLRATDPKNLFYSNPEQWTYAAQYPVYQTTINVSNGMASFTLPESIDPATIFVEAVLTDSSTNLEFIAENMLFVMNPITISGSLIFRMIADGATQYELGYNVEYHTSAYTSRTDAPELDVETAVVMLGTSTTTTTTTPTTVIEDNVSVSVSTETTIYPSVAVTDNGMLGGVILAPRQPWPYTINPRTEAIEPAYQVQPVRLTVSNFNGYPISLIRIIHWDILTSNEPNKGSFYVEVQNGPQTGASFWTDGEDTSSLVIKSNLSNPINISRAGEDAIRRLEGYDQVGGVPTIINANWALDILCNGKSKSYIASSIGTTRPETFPSSSLRWNNGIVNFGIKPYNRNVGRGLEWFFKATTSYSNTASRISPYLLDGFQTCPPNDGIDPPPFCKCLPSVWLTDPLSITLTDETEGYYLRDGTSTATIVATIKWKDEHIRDAIKMPRVAFVAGTNGQPNLSSCGEGTCIPQVFDMRFKDYLGINIHPDVNLEPYFLDASYTRTDIDISTNHTHECVVDDNGNGSTTKTIRIEDSTTPNHTHTIVNYTAETYPSLESSSSSESLNSESSVSSDDVPQHSHEVRCVGVTAVLPTTNISVEMRIIGYVLYDPTHCLPNFRGTGAWVPDYLFPPESIIKNTYTYYVAQRVNRWGSASENNYYALYVAPAETYYSGSATSGSNYSGDPIILNKNAAIGDNKIYLATSTSGFSYGIGIKIMSNKSSETNTVISTSLLDSNVSGGAYLLLATPLKNAYLLSDNPMIVVVPVIDIALTKSAIVGDTTVYVTTTNGISANTMVSITSSRKQFPVLVTGVGLDETNGSFISFTPALPEDLDLQISPVNVFPGLNIQSSDPNVRFVPKTIVNTTYLENRVMADDISLLGLGYGSDASRLKIEVSVNNNMNTNPYSETWEITGNNSTDLANVHSFNSQFFTAETPYVTLQGFDIKVKGSYSSYHYWDTNTSPWTLITVPERLIADGSRVSLDITGYLPEAIKDELDVTIIEPGTVRKYAILKCDVTFADLVDDLYAKGSFKVYVNSLLQWIPGTFALTYDFTDDVINISNAISQINWLGASQLYDAVYLASNRMIQAQYENNTYQDYVKTIFIVSDGDENKSENSLNQAVKNTNFINGKMIVPLDSVQLGLTSTSDEIVLIKLADGTNGTTNKMINSSDSEIIDLIDSMITDKNNRYNHGTYADYSTFEQDSIPVSVAVNDYSVGPNQSIDYSTRQSLDDNTWTPWTDPLSVLYTTTYEESPDNITRYLGYDIALYGDEYFNSPAIYSSPVIKYLDPETVTVSFMPIGLNVTNKEYLSSILITHEVDIPNTSSIQYGVAQVVSKDLEDYYIDGKYVDADTHQIMLTRYNEPLLTLNYKKYVALNGRWPSKCSIEVYRINSSSPNGQLVDSSLYAKNSKEGTIIFPTVQPKADKFLICVYFDSLFRIVQKTMNYGRTPAVTHYIGAIYNTMKRIPTNSNGNIIHKDIGSLI